MSVAEKAIKALDYKLRIEEKVKREAEEQQATLLEQKMIREEQWKKRILESYKSQFPADTVDSIELGISLTGTAILEKVLIEKENRWIRKKNKKFITARGVRGFYTPRPEKIVPPTPYFIWKGQRLTPCTDQYGNEIIQNCGMKVLENTNILKYCAPGFEDRCGIEHGFN